MERLKRSRVNYVEPWFMIPREALLNCMNNQISTNNMDQYCQHPGGFLLALDLS